MLVVIALLGASPVDSDIDLILDRSQWEMLKVLGAPDADQGPWTNWRSSGWSRRSSPRCEMDVPPSHPGAARQS
jgi:hypothetical protein